MIIALLLSLFDKKTRFYFSFAMGWTVIMFQILFRKVIKFQFIKALVADLYYSSPEVKVQQVKYMSIVTYQYQWIEAYHIPSHMVQHQM